MSNTREPERLKKGKAFHAKIQNDWRLNAQGRITVEKSVLKPSGRKGRIDVHVDSENAHVGVGVGEIKATAWDEMTEPAVRRNVRRQARQIWTYIESQLAKGHSVSPGVIFPTRPSEARLRLVEVLFDREGVAIVWDDETIEERKARG
jgi:hypothetical protein